jgi:RNA polymerase sigma-70 factor, ECF subfamily
MMTEPDEVVLVRRTLEGDEQAFAQLVRAYEKVLFNLALRMVRNHEDARDLTQAVFIRTYQNLHRFDGRHRFFSWIYRIMINESLNHLKRQRPKDALDERIAELGRGPAEERERAQIDERVDEAVMGLSEMYRDVIVMRHFLGLSHVEMSRQLGIPEKTVKSRLHTARERLAGVLRHSGIVSS